MPVSKKKAASSDKKKIGIILANDIDEGAVPALKYLILHLNCLQTYFEYEFFPEFKHSLFDVIGKKQVLDRKLFEKKLPKFLADYDDFLTKQRIDYDLEDTESLPDFYILISLMRFEDQYYLTGIERLGVVAMGNWKRFMAPPSLLEFILTTVLVDTVYLLDSSPGISHLGTKGCLFDFSAELGDARYGTLQSFICNNCREALSDGGYPGLSDELAKILDKSWLGDSTSPSSPAGIISNLKYDLFLTKGLTPTFWERTVSIIQTDGVKEILKLLGAVLLAAALVYFGLAKH